MKEEVILTDEQKAKIRDLWNSKVNANQVPPTLLELITVVFPGKDGRTKEGIAVRSYLASLNIKAKSSHEWKTRSVEIELTPEQMEYIKNQCQTMTCLEMTQELFNNKSLRPSSAEYKRIYKYIQIHPEFNARSDMPPLDEYGPPKNLNQAINRLLKYRIGDLNPEKLSASQTKCLMALIEFLHNFRFLHQINSYSSLMDQELFESTFIRYTYDKLDFTEEEIDRYILLCTDAVIASNILKTIDMFQREQDEAIRQGNKLSMTLVEATNTARKEYNECIRRQERLYESLVTNRSQRIQQQASDTASLLNFFNLWKQEENRTEWINEAQKYQEEAKEAVKTFRMSELISKLGGISEEEAVNG